MLRSLWIAKTGLDAQQLQLDQVSHNLANVSTIGYKRSQAQFEDLIYQNIRQSGAQSTQQTQLPTGLQQGTGVRPVATMRNFSQGNLQQTGKFHGHAPRALDVRSHKAHYCAESIEEKVRSKPLHKRLHPGSFDLLSAPDKFPFNTQTPPYP